jgi:hypothetical protein
MSGGEDSVLAAVGRRWAMSRQESDRDIPSRRKAYELARSALGRHPSEEECIAVQRAARAASGG